MDAFDITTKDNPGSSLPMSSNAVLKEEFEFLPQIGNQTSLKVLKRLSYVATFIAAFGLTYNGTSLAYFPSSYNIICTLTSLISLALSTALIFWSTKTLKKQQDNTILSNDDNSAELLNHGLYTAAMFRAVVSIPIIANMFFQGDNTLHHLRAFGATYEDASYQDTEATLRSIGSVQPFLEVLLSLFFIQATRTIFPHIREPVNAVTRMIFIGSAVLMASSFALIYSARYASDYQTLHNLKFPSLDLDGFMLLGAASVIIAGLVWFMNHIKSENHFSRTATVLGSLTLGLAILSGFGYSNTQEITRQFGSFENLNTEWAEQMAGTSIQDIENYGCPSKYLPRHIASDPSFERLWGPGATTRDGLESRFLNIACTELFGNQQASSFAEATSFGLLSIASSLIIILGFLYFKHIQWRNVEAGSKKDFRWLGLFGFMFLVFAGTMIFYTPPTPSQNGFAFGTRAHAFDIIHDSENMLLAGLDTNPYGGIYKDIIARKYRFVVLKDHPTIPATTIAQAGPWAWKFNDFVNAIVSDEEQVGIVQLGEPGFETPYVVVYAPRVARIQDVLSGFNVAGDTQTLQQNGLPGAHYYIARNKDDLDLQKILFESRVGTIALLNEAETNNGMVMEDYGLVLAAAADNTYSGVFRLLTSKQRRFLVLKHDPVNPMNIRVETGPWAWLFSDFANAFISTQEQVGFIMLGQEGKEQPYMVVYGPQNTKAEQVLNGFGLPLNTQDLQQQGLAGVNSYVAHIKDEINLNNVVMNSRSGRILVLAGEEEDPSGLILAGASPYDVPFQHLKDRKARFVVLSHDTRSYQKINIAEGNSQSLFNDFADQFEDGKELVGLMLLGETNKEKPYLVILAPGNKNAAQVLSGFQLPTNTNQFEKLGFKGINYYVAKKKKDIDLTKVVMQSKLTGDINMYQDAALMLATDDANPYGNIFEALSDKKYRYVVLKRDPQNPLNINVEAAPWNWLFQDFVNAIDPTQEQVGIIYLGQADSEKPYVIVFTPRNGGSSVSTVLNEFALPGSTAELEKAGLPGVSYYVAREMRDLDLATVVMQSKVGSISMLNDLDDPNYADFSMFASANSLYGGLIKQISDKTVRYAVLSRDPKDSSKTKVETGPWKTTFNEFAGKMDASKEQVGIIVLGQGNQEKPFVVITAPKNANVGAILNSYGLPGTVEELEKLGLKNVNAYVVRDKSDLNMARVVMWAKSKGQISFIDEDGQEIFVDVASSPYNNLFDLLSKKKHRFAVLRHDPQNPMNIKVVVAPWDLEFKDFVQTINPTQEQVGIVYLGQTGAEVPYLVVFSPPGTTTSGVLDGFGLPYNTAELAKAGLPGVQYYVADEIRDLDLNNIVMRAQQGTITVLSEQVDQEGMFMNAAELEAGQDYSVLQATASSPYAPLLKALAERRYRFIKLKTNPENNLGVKVTGGPWAATFDQFLGVMEANTEQVAFVYVGPQNQEKLYRVVVAPNGNAGKILDNLQLPRTASQLEKIGLRGVPTYVASSGSDLTAQKIITGSKADVA